MDRNNQMGFWDWLNSLPAPEIIFLTVFLIGGVILVGSLFSGLTLGPVAIPSIKGWWRIFGIILGAVLMMPASYSSYLPYMQSQVPKDKSTVSAGTKGIENGSVCESKVDCASGYCYPAPHPRPGGSDTSVCIAADMNCALPGFDGAFYGAVISLDGSRLTCKNPGDGRAQFVR